MDLKKLYSLLLLACLCLSCSNSIKLHKYSGYALGTSFSIVYSSENELFNIEKLSDSIFFEIKLTLQMSLLKFEWVKHTPAEDNNMKMKTKAAIGVLIGGIRNI